MIADAANDDPARYARLALCAAAGAVTAIDAVLLTTFENRMLGDDVAQIDDADQIGELLDLDNPAGAIRDCSSASTGAGACSSRCSGSWTGRRIRRTASAP